MTPAGASPPEREPRKEELFAFQAICAVEDVGNHEWLPETGDGGTPDLEIVIGGQVVTVEITAHTSGAINALFNVAEGNSPFPAPELSHDWTIVVSDQHTEDRGSQRRLKDLVKAAARILRKAEQSGGTPETIRTHAAELLDPDPYDPYELGAKASWTKSVDSSEWGGDGISDKQAAAEIASHCDYWYPLDLFDRVTKELRPRHVRPSTPVPAQGPDGSITVLPTAGGGGCVPEAVDRLVPALQKEIGKKQNRDQMKGISGERWLAVVIDGGCAALQLEEAAKPEALSPHPGLSEFEFTVFDEVWAIGPTFAGRSFAVVRLPKSGSNQRRCIVPRP